MAERLSDRLEEFLKTAQGKEVSLSYLRTELRIDPGTTAWNSLRVLMHNLAEKKIVKLSGRNDGVYKVITQVHPVKVFGRERKPPITIRFPRAQDTGEELLFAQDIIFREGDAITLGGVSNYGKTTLCLNFCGENIHSNPVLMGNEYTSLDGEPMPRFLSRLDDMEWVEWADEMGEDRFTLLPVREDYAEHVVKDKINIIDWVNIDGGQSYDISKVMDVCKREVRHGILIVALQKNEDKNAARGGSYTKDFTDCELLLDPHGEGEILLTIGKLKEPKKGIRHPSGRMFAYKIIDGVKIMNFREVVRCSVCKGAGHDYKGKSCEACDGRGKVDKGIF